MTAANSRLAWGIQVESLFKKKKKKVQGIVVLLNKMQDWGWKSPT